MGKIFVKITAEHDTNGTVRPLEMTWGDGRRFPIDRILDVRKAASLKGGGLGMRYVCRICGKQVNLFDDEGKWFIQGETKTNIQTKLQYIDKPFLVYTDPTTGQTGEKTDPTDMRLTADPAKVNVSVNGKPYAFDLLQDESQKFEKGQVTLDQTSTIDFKMDVQPTIIDNTASGGIDVYAGNKDIGIGVRHNRIGIVAGWNRKDKDMEYRLRWEVIQFK